MQRALQPKKKGSPEVACLKRKTTKIQSVPTAKSVSSKSKLSLLLPPECMVPAPGEAAQRSSPPLDRRLSKMIWAETRSSPV